MASGTPYTVKWGILATGGIAESFCKDILTDPAARSVHDVAHRIVAVSSSTSADRASSFIKKMKIPNEVKAYGSYAELVADPDVDIIYVATPHSHHFQNAMLALNAGKHVLCEKALTVTFAQATKLIETARAKGLFLMEAVWTRFFPLSIQIRKAITSGEIGTVYRTVADLSRSYSTDNPNGDLDVDDANRMVNPNLAGGALLDLGIYALTWVFQTLYHVQSDAEKEEPHVLAAINKYRTGADENTSIILQFPKHRSMGIATTSLVVDSNPHGESVPTPAIRIQGSKGEIQVHDPAYQPISYSIIKKDGNDTVEVVRECVIPKDPKRDNWGHGMFWEADECARCLRDGKQQSDTMPWSESLVIMKTMDSALKQGGVNYPDLITSDVYDPKSPLNTGNQ